MRQRARLGFTLIELLLVLVLIGILTAIAAPNFVRSIRGNRLRVAARTVVMAGRYARSMAVLEQRDLLLTFNLDDASLKVEDIVLVPASESVEDERAASEFGEPIPAEDEPAYKVQSRTQLLERALDEVSLQAVVVEDQPVREGTVSVIYASNGRCMPYEVEIVDSDGRGTRVRVDVLSVAQTERL